MTPRPSLMPDMTRFQARPMAFLFHYVGRHKLGHSVIIGAVILAVICSSLTNYGMKLLIDVVSRGPAAPGVVQASWAAFALVCALIAADNVLWRIAGFTVARIFVRVTGDVRSDLFVHLAGHAPAYFAERLPGTMASRITATSNAVFQTESTGTWNVIPPILAVIIAIILVATVNPLMAACLAAVSLTMAALVFWLANRGTPIHRSFATQAAGVDGEFVDIISNMHVVRAFGATWRERGRINTRLAGEMAARRFSLFYLEKLRLLHAVMTALITTGLLAWAVLMWQHGLATPGDMVLITASGFTILHGTRDLAVSLVDLTQHVARLEEAITSLLTPHDLPDAPQAVALPRGPGRVTFEHVTFGYPNRAPVLANFSLSIEPGQRVGLVGASGAGKSTVIALLQRFYDVQSGQIRIDGADIRSTTQESLRAAMAIVPQDISLFHRTILENLRYARPDAAQADILEAASIARCRAFIEALPEGFDTMVGDRGVKLSGGQRQRLAIARALLKDAPILLLDEATSALDSESEQAIQQALDVLMQGRTVIAIAHRLSTLRNFDRIIVMDRGHVIDDGAPDTLANRPGPYRDLLHHQMMGADANPG